MTNLLRGTAFITGAASGIGKGTARAFAHHGITHLSLADVNPTALHETASALQTEFPSLVILEQQVDVRDTEAVRVAIAATVDKFGRLDVAVNNAGISGSGMPTHEVSEEEVMRVMDVNLNGVWRCQKEELKAMVGQEDLGPRTGRGRIINVASMYGVVAPSHHITHTAYTTAKHGVLGLTRADANSYGPKNIRINAICPGYISTPLIAGAMETDSTSPLAKDIERTAFQRLGQVDEIADCIVFMASDMSSFMQGASLVADGGFTIQ